MSEHYGWVAVDLDGTLATFPHSFPEIGPPIPRMVERVKGWLADGKDVRIFTARVACTGIQSEYGIDDQPWCDEQRMKIELWCVTHLGARLKVTAVKDFQMAELWDDRCVQMQPNTGMTLAEFHGLLTKAGDLSAAAQRSDQSRVPASTPAPEPTGSAD